MGNLLLFTHWRAGGLGGLDLPQNFKYPNQTLAR